MSKAKLYIDDYGNVERGFHQWMFEERQRGVNWHQIYTTDHAEELARLLLLAKLDLVWWERKHGCNHSSDVIVEIDKALTNYREATK